MNLRILDKTVWYNWKSISHVFITWWILYRNNIFHQDCEQSCYCVFIIYEYLYHTYKIDICVIFRILIQSPAGFPKEFPIFEYFIFDRNRDHVFCILYSERINIIGSTGKRKARLTRTCGSIEGIFSRCAGDDVDIGLCEHCNKKIGIDTDWWDIVSLVERRE